MDKPNPEPATQQPLARGSRLWGLIRLRCPVCLQAPIFSGAMTMNEHCPNCGRKFEQEEGFFLGAMYASYGLSIGWLLLLTLLVHLVFPQLDWGLAVLVAAAVYVPFVPWTWRCSRTIYLYFDHWASPHRW